jgi:hypothetical protein
MSKIENTSRLEVAKIVADSGRKQTQGDAFGKFAAAASGWLGSKWAFVGAIVIIAVLGDHGTALPLLRYLAARHKHGNDYHHIPHGLHYPEHAES